MNSLVSLTLPKLHMVLCSPLAEGCEPVHYPGLLPPKGAHTPLCRMAHAGLATSQELLLAGALLETHKHELCSTTQLQPTALLTGHSFK